MLCSELSVPRRERFLAVQLNFDSVNEFDQVALPIFRGRSTVQTWFGTFRKGGVEAMLMDGKRAMNPWSIGSRKVGNSRGCFRSNASAGVGANSEKLRSWFWILADRG